MRRWATISDYITNDQDRLQRITIYAADEDKRTIKSDTKGYNHTRLLLVPEKAQNDSRYIITKISRI